MKSIKQTQTRDILDAYNREDISYSRMNEMFNEIADEFAIGFAEWKDKNCFNQGDGFYNRNYIDEVFTLKELLEIYKKETL